MATKDADRPSRLFLLRHGDTDWSDSRKHTGRTDIPLNASGEQHALLLGARLKGERFARVFVSPLLRVRRTCQLAGFADQAEICPNLTEWDYGDFEGLLTADVHRTRSDWYLYRDGAPNGESPDQVAARADRFINLVRPIDGDVAAFSSAQIIRMVAARWLGLPPLAAKYFYTATASVGILGYEHDQIQPVVHLWDDLGALDKNI
ncbi:MAG: histidine phosphatase family protein [Tepidisphaeraceae bacterium]|jgi:probable phosphoglycerate mutase